MRELLASISADELMEWTAYSQLDPFGSERADLHAGIIASTVWNVNADNDHKLKPRDFMPSFGRPAHTPAMSPAEIRAKLDRMFGRGARRG